MFLTTKKVIPVSGKSQKNRSAYSTHNAVEKQGKKITSDFLKKKNKA